MKEKVSLTWYFNETVSIDSAFNYETAFTCNLSNFVAIGSARSFAGFTFYFVTGTYKRTEVYSNNKWKNSIYRTVTFDEEPTGDLLTFLRANATPL